MASTRAPTPKTLHLSRASERSRLAVQAWAAAYEFLSPFRRPRPAPLPTPLSRFAQPHQRQTGA
jgi:hypothetical protein